MGVCGRELEKFRTPRSWGKTGSSSMHVVYWRDEREAVLEAAPFMGMSHNAIYEHIYGRNKAGRFSMYDLYGQGKGSNTIAYTVLYDRPPDHVILQLL